MTTALELMEIPCALIDASPHQNREVFDPHKLRELADSIAESGLLQPLRCRVSDAGLGLGTDGPRYVLVAGERRLRACRDLLGWVTVPATIDDGHDETGLALATLAENMIRDDPGPMEEARGLQAVGLGPAELARRLGKSRNWVTDRLALLRLADDVSVFVQLGELPIGRAVTMSDLDVNRQRLALQAHEHGVTADGFRALVGKLLTEQSEETIFDADTFLRVEEYVMEAETEAAGFKPAPIRERPCGIAEIAEMLEVKSATVHQWRQRGLFPDPTGSVGGSPYWYEADVLAWATETGRLSSDT